MGKFYIFHRSDRFCEINALVFFDHCFRDFYADLKYREDEPDRIGELFTQSVGR